MAPSGAIGAKRRTSATNSRSAAKLSFPPSIASYTRATLGLLTSKSGHSPSPSGSPSATVGLHPAAKASICEHSGSRSATGQRAKCLLYTASVELGLEVTVDPLPVLQLADVGMVLAEHLLAARSMITEF